MAQIRRLRRDRPFYLIPIMMGMAGVLFSSQLEDPVQRGIVILLCLAVPLFIGGNVLARIHSGGLQRILLLAGLATLTLGAVVTVSGLSDSLVDSEYVSREIGELSRQIGMGSLMLGLLVVLYTMVRSEAVIDELGERFQHIADHMGEGLVMLDARGAVVLINSPLTAMTGIELEDLQGKRVLDLASEYQLEPFLRHGERRSRGMASEYEVDWEFEEQTLRFLITESPLFDRRKRRVGTLLTVHDITEEHRLKRRLEEYTQGLQKLVEKRTDKLRASEQRFRDLLVHMNEGFLTTDSEYNIRFTNERVQQILRFDEEMIRGRNIFDFVELGERGRLRGALEQVAQGEPQREGQEYTFMREDGGYIPVKVSIAPVEGGEEERAHYSLVITDVQELKEAHHELEVRARELERANEELRELDRAKDVFLSNVSHELRTPLATIDGYIEMFQSDDLGEVDAPHRAALEVMSRNVGRLTSLINEMIESSRMEIRGVHISEAIFDLGALIEESIDSMQPQAIKGDISVNAHNPVDFPYVWGDREKIGQVLGILLSNAIKFSREGSVVSVHARIEGDRDLCLVVADTGIGIPEEYREQIFRKFFQVDASMTRHYQGTGIGLSIAKGIVEAHGGRIEVESEPNKGSTFSLFFPEAIFDTHGEVEAPLTGKRVFLLQRFPEFRAALTDLFESVGAECVAFQSGYECIRQSQEVLPDLIVLDESVSDISASDVLAGLKNHLNTAEIPIITIRGGSREDSSSELLSVACSLSKPFPPVALIEAAKKSLGLGVVDHSGVSKQA